MKEKFSSQSSVSLDAIRVGLYVSLLNSKLSELTAHISGEVTSVSLRGTYLFFTLKDKIDESILQCFMWKRDYDLSGVELKEGMEVVAHGVPEIYKARGSFSFRSDAIFLVGEGALKKAYDELRKTLSMEGIFENERKKILPKFPQSIGLITSETGAVIHDFLTNLGKHGFSIQFYNVRVEGQYALRDILTAINYFKTKKIDVLVIIRGGGSLEVMQPFNTEPMVREIARFPKPVLCGIGHDKDVPLACLAADISVSTPSMATEVLNRSWKEAKNHIELMQKHFFYSFGSALQPFLSGDNFHSIESHFSDVLEKKRVFIENTAKLIFQNDPLRQMKLGWSILRKNGKVVRKVGDVKVGDSIAAEILDGTIDAEIKSYEKHKK